MMSPARRRQLDQATEYMQQRFDRADGFDQLTRELLREAHLIFGTAPGVILSGSHERLPVLARTFVIHRLRHRGHSLPWIGKQLGGMHHTTIGHALRKPIQLDEPELSGVDESGIWAI